MPHNDSQYNKNVHATLECMLHCLNVVTHGQVLFLLNYKNLVFQQ